MKYEELIYSMCMVGGVGCGHTRCGRGIWFCDGCNLPTFVDIGGLRPLLVEKSIHKFVMTVSALFPCVYFPKLVSSEAKPDNRSFLWNSVCNRSATPGMAQHGSPISSSSSYAYFFVIEIIPRAVAVREASSQNHTRFWYNRERRVWSRSISRYVMFVK